MTEAMVEFFRCPEWFADSELRLPISNGLSRSLNALYAGDPVWQDFPASELWSSAAETLIDNLRHERYAANTETTVGALLIREAYYVIRPVLTVSIRRHLQRLFLRKWISHTFPRWPVDRTVDQIHEAFLLQAMKLKGVDSVPFIWFWPNGHSSCALMTHDVETGAGLDFCPQLMDIDDAAGIKSSFQFIPEQRYSVSEAALRQTRDRGFEVNVHDLNHDGHLFRDRKTFLHRVERINEYGRKFGASGFRAGALYRNQAWFEALQFSYEMSVPNVAHLDPQHGGCCTLFPYFIGDLLELPVTGIQDYSLFHVLGTYSTDLWRTQLTKIANHHGLIHLITHPDYVIEERAQQSYKRLLTYMDSLRRDHDVWITRPAEVNDWWRQRSRMRLLWQEGKWRIEGAGSARAKIAYATTEGDNIAYRIEGQCLPRIEATPDSANADNALYADRGPR